MKEKKICENISCQHLKSHLSQRATSILYHTILLVMKTLTSFWDPFQLLAAGKNTVTVNILIKKIV